MFVPEAQKVTFPFPLKGEQLIELVERIVNENTDISSRFMRVKHELNGLAYHIGQWSAFDPGNNLIVAVTTTKRGIRLDGRYKNVVVMHHSWSPGVQTSGQSNDVLQNLAARQLAGKLRTYYSNLNDEARWPQELEICDSCSRPVKWINGRPYCPKHKEGVLLRTVKVVLAPE